MIFHPNDTLDVMGFTKPGEQIPAEQVQVVLDNTELRINIIRHYQQGLGAELLWYFDGIEDMDATCRAIEQQLQALSQVTLDWFSHFDMTGCDFEGF